MKKFDEKIQFTVEAENKVYRNNKEITASFYRKKTNSSTYLNWKIFIPLSWKSGTSRTPVQCVYLVCSADTYLKEERTQPERAFLPKEQFH